MQQDEVSHTSQMLEGQKYCANCVVHNINVGVIENRQGYSCDLKKIYLNAKVKVRYDNAFRYFPQKNLHYSNFKLQCFPGASLPFAKTTPWTFTRFEFESQQ